MNFIDQLVDIAKKYKLREYISPQLDFTVNILSVAIYIDYKIKDIELIHAKQIIKQTIKTLYPNITEEKSKELSEYYYVHIKNELHLMQENPGYLELQKMKIYNQKNLLSKKDMQDIQDIIKADAIYTKEERNFYEELEKSM